MISIAVHGDFMRQINELYLMLTEKCPNRCSYCYINHLQTKNTMDTDIIDKSIKQYNPKRIILFGGEPLIELDRIQYIFHKYYQKINIQIVTSTVINFKGFINIIKDLDPNWYELQVSWDGFNDNRVDINGTSISSKVYNNIEWAISERINPFDIKCVISEDNVSELIDIHNIFLNQWFPIGRGEFIIAHRTDTSEKYFKELNKQLPNLFDLKHPYTFILNYLQTYIYRAKSFISCDVGKYVVVQPDGRISQCTALSQDRVNDFGSDELQEPCLHPDCINCKYKYMCDGGCRYERISIFGPDNWRSNYLKSTCKLMEIVANSCYHWWDLSNDNEKENIANVIEKYVKWRRNFYKY